LLFLLANSRLLRHQKQRKMAIPRRRVEEVPENRILKIGFRLGHGTVPGPEDSKEVPLVEVDGSKTATYCGVEIVDVEGRAMGGEELVLDVVVLWDQVVTVVIFIKR
jgi:hypothetical protein